MMSAVDDQSGERNASVVNNCKHTLEQTNTHLFRQPLRILVDSNIEAKNTSELFRFLQHCRSTHNVLLVDWTDVDAGHWDLAHFQELQQRLKRTQGTGLNANTTTGFVDGVEQGRQVRHNLVHEILLVIFRPNDQQA